MYRDFFGLTLSPFNNTPDPRFFFNTPDHEEAVASLIYAAQERKGFALLTGEVGSGKTLISRLVLSRLERSAKFAVVHNTRVGPRELLFSICREFDVRIAPDAAAPEMSRALEEFLLDQYARDRLAVVIVDEAQHLTAESFEELRLLGNLEANDAKLMSVLILGQPELQETFRVSEMRQLQQRLFRSFHLKALSRELTEGYVTHRLRVAGIPEGRVVFDRLALEAVFRASGGIPRLINQVCDGALLAAYTRSAKRVTAALVAEVVEQNRAFVASPRTNVTIKTQPIEHNATQRIIVETRQAEEAVRLLEDRVREAANSSECSRKLIEESLTSAKTEFAGMIKEFSTDAATKRSHVGDAVAEAREAKRDLAAFVEDQRRQLDSLLKAVDGTIKQATEQTSMFKNNLDELKGAYVADLQTGRKELDHRRAELEVRAREAMNASDHSRKVIEESLVSAKTEVADMLKELSAETAARRAYVGDAVAEAREAKRDLAAFVEDHRRQLDSLLKTVDGTIRRASEQTSVFKNNLDELKGVYVADLQAGRKELDHRIAEAARIGTEIEGQSQGVNAQMTAASRELQRTCQAAMDEARQATVLLREQRGASLGELREAMTQINERASTVRQDLVELGDQVKSGSANCVEGIKNIVSGQLQQIDRRAGMVRKELMELGDQVKHGSAKSVEGLKQMVAGLLNQINAKQFGFRAEVEQAGTRIGQTEQQIGRVIAAARDSAKQVMDETRAQSEAIQSHAQTSATTIQEQAAGMLAEARGFVEQMREQAEATVRRADATAENTCRDLQDLRSDLRKDREQVREQILASKVLIAEAKDEAARLIELARSEASRLIDEARRTEGESQERAERLLQQARESEGRAESLLRMPRELIDEANARAAALAEMSRTVSSVVAHLGAAGDAAKMQTRDIREAGTLAEERLELLKQHTARVGQLVGIIRQLYGVMDARIDGLRSRLDQADDLCRSVPNEIDSLRSVLTDGRTKRGMSLGAEPAVPAEPGKRRPARGKTVAGGSTGATSDGPVGQGTLGDIVSRNRKLHEWLRQTLREAEADEAAGVDNKADDAARLTRTAAREVEDVAAK